MPSGTRLPRHRRRPFDAPVLAVVAGFMLLTGWKVSAQSPAAPAAPAPSVASPASAAAPVAANSPAPTATPAVPAPAPPPAASQDDLINALNPAEVQEAINLLRANYIRPPDVDDRALARATLAGVLTRLGNGAFILPKPGDPNAAPRC